MTRPSTYRKPLVNILLPTNRFSLVERMMFSAEQLEMDQRRARGFNQKQTELKFINLKVYTR